MTTDWLMRVGDGENLKNSSKHEIWGITNKSPHGKHFTENVQPGDRLWFVKNNSQGKLIGVATYQSHNLREFGILINKSLTNEELGWSVTNSDYNVEVKYSDLYVLNNCDLLTHIKGPSTIRKYDEKCKINLPVEYSYIVRYSNSKITFKF